MRFLQTLVSNIGFREPAANDRRTELFRELLSIAKARSAEALVLPGGYWTVDDFAKVEPKAHQMCEAADRAGIALIAGVDVQTGKASKAKVKQSKGGSNPHLPYFGFVGGHDLELHVWQQTSSDSRNAWDLPDEDIPGTNRVVPIGGARIGVLICGELFSPHARASMAAASPTLVIDLGHVSMGTGVTPSMERIAADGRCAVVHTQHVTPYSSASLHFVAKNGKRNSTPLDGCSWIGDNQFWVAYCLREC